MRAWKLVAVLLSAGLFGSVSVCAYRDRELALALYARAPYYVMTALFLAWGVVMARHLREEGASLAGWLRRNGPVLIAALLMTILIVASVKARFRVLSDETNLLSVSHAMVLDRTAYNYSQGKVFFGRLRPLQAEVEKRPMAYPYLVYLFHLARGYTPSNAFAANAVVLWALLAACGALAARFLGQTAGVAAVLLVASYPMVALVARSGGFDLFAALMAVLTAVTYWRLTEWPSASRFGAWLATSLVFANCRYESAVILAVLGAGLIVLRAPRLEWLDREWLLLTAAPFFFLPLCVQRILIPFPYENPPGVPAFAPEHFARFARVFWESQWRLDFFLPHSPLLFWTAALAAAVVLLGGRIPGARAWSPHARRYAWIVGVAFLANLGIFFCYYFGDYAHPASARFFLTTGVACALAPIALAWRLPRWLTPGRTLLFGLFAFTLYHPVAIVDRFTEAQTLVAEAEIEYTFLGQHASANPLVVTSRPGQFTVLDVGAIRFETANRDAQALLSEWQRHLYSDFFVFQRVSYETRQPVEEDRLDPRFRLEPLFELQATLGGFVRISRVSR